MTSTLSNNNNCAIHKMMVAVAQNVPDYTPRRVTVEAFYNRISSEVKEQYYNQSSDVMSKLDHVTTEQWIDYYNQYMPQIFTQMRQHQDQDAIDNIFTMLNNIGK